MADEFNLVPTNNTEKFLDNILRAAQGETPQYPLAPNWRIEAYLDAIKSALSASAPVPAPTSSDNGKVLTVSSGEAAWRALASGSKANSMLLSSTGNGRYWSDSRAVLTVIVQLDALNHISNICSRTGELTQDFDRSILSGDGAYDIRLIVDFPNGQHRCFAGPGRKSSNGNCVQFSVNDFVLDEYADPDLSLNMYSVMIRIGLAGHADLDYANCHIYSFTVEAYE